MIFFYLFCFSSYIIFCSLGKEDPRTQYQMDGTHDPPDQYVSLTLSPEVDG